MEKPLSNFIFTYANHNDNKYDGEIGGLRRKQVVISDIEHIGKESNNLEESEAVSVSDNDYVIYDNTMQKIIDTIKNLSYAEARKIGISQGNLSYLKKKVREGKRITLKKKTMGKLLSA